LLARFGIWPTREGPLGVLSETDGWAAGMRLSIGRPNPGDAGNRLPAQRDLIREFLVHEILDPMPAVHLMRLRASMCVVQEGGSPLANRDV
jgi:ATP/maltotriose-dependent transcriptional regulator MalT